MEKPEKLYRGISVDHIVFDGLNFDADMYPNTPPKIDENGRKVVGDGNEYGIYMTDNKNMALDTYGNCHGNGVYLGTIGKQYFALPLVGVTFEIDTKNLDIRNPWITGYLEGVYNNGYGGKEWIADVIPNQNYKLYRIIVGDDTLNEKRELDKNLPIKVLKQQVRDIIEKRMEGFKLCMYHASKNPQNAEFNLKIYQKLFSENGIAFDKNTKYDKNNPLEILKNLMRVEYRKDIENLHYKELKYLLQLEISYSCYKNIDKLIEIISSDKKAKHDALTRLIQKDASIAHIEKEIAFLDRIATELESLKSELQKQ